MKLRAFETLDNLYKLYEAAEDEAADNTNEEATDDSAEEGASEEAPEDGGEAPQDENATPEIADDENPEVQADPTDGVFVASENKALLAKVILNALLFSPTSNSELIPDELKNISINDINADNADKIINTIGALTKNK